MSSNPAPLWRRFAAALYDLFPLIALWMLTVWLCLLAAGGSIDAAHPPAEFRLAEQIALFVVTAAYFTISWARGGQTIGMRAWRLRVVADDGRRLPWPRALLRCVAANVSLLAFGLGFLWCLIDRERRGWHDMVARSRVERIDD